MFFKNFIPNQIRSYFFKTEEVIFFFLLTSFPLFLLNLLQRREKAKVQKWWDLSIINPTGGFFRTSL